MLEVVINRCYGGFSLSRAAFLRLRELGCPTALAEPDVGEKWDDGSVRASAFGDSFCRDISRSDPLLVQVVRELRNAANGACADLKIAEIPDEVKWAVEEYDGIEHIAEVHRTWA